jgi:hypothetical protein
MTALYEWFMAALHEWEVPKLVLQLLGAAFIAWLTVRLALRRFKSEKTWERQISTLADLLVAIEEMHRIAEFRLNAEIEHREIREEQQNDLGTSYGNAMSDFEKGAAMAAVLLPPNIYGIVKQLHTTLATYEPDSLFDLYETKGFALEKAREQLIEAGRKLQAK